MRFKVDFVHAALSLGGCGQACPDMPKESFETYYLKNCWKSRVDFWTPVFRQK